MTKNQKSLAALAVLVGIAAYIFWPKKKKPESIIAGDITIDEVVPSKEGILLDGDVEIIDSDPDFDELDLGTSDGFGSQEVADQFADRKIKRLNS